MPNINFDSGVVAEETKPEQEAVPEVKIKFADPDDGLEENCTVCGDTAGGCAQCGFGRGK